MKKIITHILLAMTLLYVPATASAFQFGYVDAAKIFSMYSETQKTKNILESEKAKLQKELDTKKQQLSEMDNKYVETAKKIQDLRDSKKEEEARKLENQLKTQRESLANANMELQKFFEESQKRLYEMEEEKMGTLSKDLDEVVDAVIQQIAAQKKLEAVFEKRFCYFGGMDITDEVISALNKQGAAKSATAPGAAQKNPPKKRSGK